MPTELFSWIVLVTLLVCTQPLSSFLFRNANQALSRFQQLIPGIDMLGNKNGGSS